MERFQVIDKLRPLYFDTQEEAEKYFEKKVMEYAKDHVMMRVDWGNWYEIWETKETILYIFR